MNEITITAAQWNEKCKRQELMAALLVAQNKNTTQDILTITGFMKTNEELEAHLNRNT